MTHTNQGWRAPVIVPIVIAYLLASACAQPPRPCPHAGEPAGGPSAGCFVVTPRGLLVVEHPGGSISLPGGTVEPGESARCAAARETREETGARVNVAELLHRFDSGFELFACELVQADTALLPQMPQEITSAYFLPRQQFEAARWRFPADRPIFEALYEQLTQTRAGTSAEALLQRGESAARGPASGYSKNTAGPPRRAGDRFTALPAWQPSP